MTDVMIFVFSLTAGLAIGAILVLFFDVIGRLQSEAGNLSAEVRQLRAESYNLREMLLDVVVQGTLRDDGRLDSMAISSYAVAMEYLAAHGMIEIEVSAFRRVIAKQVPR